MELIEVQDVGLRHGDDLTVSHTTTSLSRGLDHGERVVVRGGDGEYHAATVEALDFEPEDTVYTFAIGARLPAEMAAERLSGKDLDAESEGVHDVVDQLGEIQGRDDD
jgi:hypothetical protein